MTIIVEIVKPVNTVGRSMAKYVYGALKGQNVPDDVIKRVIKTIQKWAIKNDLDGKDITFDLELSEDYSKIKISNVKVWGPIESKDTTYEVELEK